MDRRRRRVCHIAHNDSADSVPVSLTDLEARLDTGQFIRIHRSAIVNFERVSHLEPISHGEFDVVMEERRASQAEPDLPRALRARLGQSL